MREEKCLPQYKGEFFPPYEALSFSSILNGSIRNLNKRRRFLVPELFPLPRRERVRVVFSSSSPRQFLSRF